MRILFFGTPPFAVPTLSALAAHHEVVGVVSKEDGKQPSAVAKAAAELGLTLLGRQGEGGAAPLLQLAWDLGVVVAYGAILPPPLLARGLLNVHPSLLPRWRGPNPIRRALWHGDAETGVSIIRLTERVDAGPILWQQQVRIADQDDYGSLSARLAAVGAEGVLQVLAAFARGTPPDERVQDEARATYAARLTAEDERVPLHLSVGELWRRVRALAPTPAAKLDLGPTTVLVRQARLVLDARLSPGELARHGEELWLGCEGGSLALVVVQPVGRRSMSGAAFARGYLRGVRQL